MEHLPPVAMMLETRRVSTGATMVDLGRMGPARGTGVTTLSILHQDKDLPLQLERRRGHGGALSIPKCDGGPVIYSPEGRRQIYVSGGTSWRAVKICWWT